MTYDLVCADVSSIVFNANDGLCRQLLSMNIVAVHQLLQNTGMYRMPPSFPFPCRPRIEWPYREKGKLS